jgi:hypothetical protein
MESDTEKTSQWKYMLLKQQKAQVIRILRPAEAHALIDAVRIEDEPNWTKSRDVPNLRESGITTIDLKTWMEFFLYSGTRFSEAMLIHDYRDPDGKTLYQNNGTLWLPRYKGKQKRTFQTRTIYFSYRGRKILKDFFDATPSLPSKTPEETKATLTSLSEILHQAGKRIGLPEKTLTISMEKTMKDKSGLPAKEMYETKNFTMNPDGTYSKVMKERVLKESYDRSFTTNGCAFRTFRKTWESWLTAFFNEPLMRDKILSSQGHKKETAINHYVEISFDKEDLEDIGKEVEGYAVLE